MNFNVIEWSELHKDCNKSGMTHCLGPVFSFVPKSTIKKLGHPQNELFSLLFSLFAFTHLFNYPFNKSFQTAYYVSGIVHNPENTADKIDKNLFHMKLICW